MLGRAYFRKKFSNSVTWCCPRSRAGVLTRAWTPTAAMWGLQHWTRCSTHGRCGGIWAKEWESVYTKVKTGHSCIKNKKTQSWQTSSILGTQMSQLRFKLKKSFCFFFFLSKVIFILKNCIWETENFCTCAHRLALSCLVLAVDRVLNHLYLSVQDFVCFMFLFVYVNICAEKGHSVWFFKKLSFEVIEDCHAVIRTFPQW